MELFKPRGAGSIRRPTDNSQMHGPIYNTPRFAPLGGLSSASKTGSKNTMAIKKPGDGHKVI
jgi:hypothetical protein